MEDSEETTTEKDLFMERMIQDIASGYINPETRMIKILKLGFRLDKWIDMSEEDG